VGFIRPEKKFGSLTDLIEQITNDVAVARSVCHNAVSDTSLGISSVYTSTVCPLMRQSWQQQLTTDGSVFPASAVIMKPVLDNPMTYIMQIPV